MEINYTAFLRSLMSVTGMYGMRPGSYSLADLMATGGALDRLASELDLAEREMMADSAEGRGLSSRRALFAILPPGLSPDAQRRAISSLMTVGDASFTAAALSAALSGCGLPAAVRDTDLPQTVCVEFPGISGIPDGFERFRPVIESILPAHVDILYQFDYAKWTDWEAKNPTWRVWDGLGESWRERESDT